MSNWKIEILDGSSVWQAMSAGEVKSCSSGTSSESQVIPDFSITFAADDTIPSGILDPELNRDTARLRISDDDSVRYFRIEKQPGSVVKGFDYPSISGRAYAGIITEWRPLTVDFKYDMTASDMARQACTLGDTAVGVVWLATQDPTIPGGRWQVSRKNRFEMLKEIVSMCGAKLRVGEDGNYFEVYDHPAKALSASATRAFSNPRSLSYEMQRIKQPGNAVRVQGEQANYTRPQLPVVSVSVDPTSIDADGSSTATATAKVYNSSGDLVQHKAMVDTAITAGSYTTIPVSGCYAVQAVWLNSGTASAPTKGTQLTVSSFTASAITVPTQTSQLFIVSYTQAESVSFSLADQNDEILGEEQDSTGTLAVSTDENIGRLIGVYRDGDTNRSGVNYYTGGSYTANTKSITLGISPGASGTSLLIDYEIYNSAPLSASISPSTALCNASGEATSTIGAGSTVGTAKITATALSQEGSCLISLEGSAVASMTLTAEKSQILVGSVVEGQTTVNETSLAVHKEGYSSGMIAVDGYVIVTNECAGSVTISSALDIAVSYYKTVGTEHRIYFRVTNSTQYVTIGTTTLGVTYNTADSVTNTAGETTITAKVLQSSGANVTNGTKVQFSIKYLKGCTLSATTATTTDGEASVTLTAGSYTGTVIVYALCGPRMANVSVDVVKTVTEDSEIGTGDYLSGGSSGSNNDSGNSGDITGKRRLICDDVPHEGVLVTFSDGSTTTTDSGGYFVFSNGATGSNTATATIDSEDYSFTWTCE